MSRYVKIALGLIAMGIVLAGIGSFLGGNGFFITNKLDTHSVEDMQLFEYENMEIGGLDSIDINVSNVPVTFCKASGDKFGVEVNYQVVDLDDVTVSVEDGELSVVAKHENYWWSFDFSFFEGRDVEEYVIVYIPEGKSLDDINVSTSNASVTMKEMQCIVNEFDINTSNADVTLSGVTVTDSLVVDTSNGQIRLDAACVCENDAKLITSNGQVDVIGGVFNRLEVKSSNGEINLDVAEVLDKRFIKVDTSNAPISVTLNNGEGEADIKADTSNGEVYINGKSVGDDDYEHAVSGGVRLELDTSNADIRIEFVKN